MRHSVGGKWLWTAQRPITGLPVQEAGSRYEQDDLRHLLATAGAMSWGITDVHLLCPHRRAGWASPAL